MISKHWTVLIREMFTDAENFGVTEVLRNFSQLSMAELKVFFF